MFFFLFFFKWHWHVIYNDGYIILVIRLEILESYLIRPDKIEKIYQIWTMLQNWFIDWLICVVKLYY